MSSAIRIYQGRFGRVALLDMDAPLVPHAHHHCHVLLKAGGADTYFHVRSKLQPLTTETAVLVNAWEPHAYEHQGSYAPKTIILALYIEPGWLKEIQHSLSASLNPRFFPQPCVQVSQHTRRIADELVNEMQWGDTIASERLEHLLFELMMSIIGPFAEWRQSGRHFHRDDFLQKDPRIRRALGYIQENVGARLNMDQLASHCGMSRAHFFSQFRLCTNVTPLVYANVLRMESAIRSLTAANDSLATISYEIGFSAPSHFTRFFRQNLGITPGQYRQVVNTCQRTPTEQRLPVMQKNQTPR